MEEMALLLLQHLLLLRVKFFKSMLVEWVRVATIHKVGTAVARGVPQIVPQTVPVEVVEQRIFV
jgi:hypothetical protein